MHKSANSNPSINNNLVCEFDVEQKDGRTHSYSELITTKFSYMVIIMKLPNAFFCSDSLVGEKQYIQMGSFKIQGTWMALVLCLFLQHEGSIGEASFYNPINLNCTDALSLCFLLDIFTQFSMNSSSQNEINR